MRRIVVLLAGMLILALLLGACGGSQAPTEAPVEEPAEEPAEVTGPLTVLAGPQEDWAQAMVAAFQEETGIETSYVRLSSGEAFSRLQAEAGSPSFDVWWGRPQRGPKRRLHRGADRALRPAERGPDS